MNDATSSIVTVAMLGAGLTWFGLKWWPYCLSMFKLSQLPNDGWKIKYTPPWKNKPVQLQESVKTPCVKQKISRSHLVPKPPRKNRSGDVAVARVRGCHQKLGATIQKISFECTRRYRLYFLKINVDTQFLDTSSMKSTVGILHHMFSSHFAEGFWGFCPRQSVLDLGSAAKKATMQRLFGRHLSEAPWLKAPGKPWLWRDRKIGRRI